MKIGDKCGQEKGVAHTIHQQRKERGEEITGTTLNFANKHNLRLLTKEVGLEPNQDA